MTTALAELFIPAHLPAAGPAADNSATVTSGPAASPKGRPAERGLTGPRRHPPGRGQLEAEAARDARELARAGTERGELDDLDRAGGELDARGLTRRIQRLTRGHAGSPGRACESS